MTDLAALTARAETLTARLQLASAQIAEAFPDHAMFPEIGLMTRPRAAEWQSDALEAAAILRDLLTYATTVSQERDRWKAIAESRLAAQIQVESHD